MGGRPGRNRRKRRPPRARFRDGLVTVRRSGRRHTDSDYPPRGVPQRKRLPTNFVLLWFPWRFRFRLNGGARMLESAMRSGRHEITPVYGRSRASGIRPGVYAG